MHWIAPSEKDTTTDTLEKRLWAAAQQIHVETPNLKPWLDERGNVRVFDILTRPAPELSQDERAEAAKPFRKTEGVPDRPVTPSLPLTT